MREESVQRVSEGSSRCRCRAHARVYLQDSRLHTNNWQTSANSYYLLHQRCCRVRSPVPLPLPLPPPPPATPPPPPSPFGAGSALATRDAGTRARLIAHMPLAGRQPSCGCGEKVECGGDTADTGAARYADALRQPGPGTPFLSERRWQSARIPALLSLCAAASINHWESEQSL